MLVLSSAFPSQALPNYGVFVKERVKALAGLPEYDVRVVAPVPYFPPIRCFPRWHVWSQVPREETVDGLSVIRPRYVLPPKLGGYFEADLFYPAVERAAANLRRHFDFDVIDAHFVYPNGVAAVRLGYRFRVPVIMTGRGEDILRFPNLPFKGKRIRWALQRGDGFVALSREIAQSFDRNGAEPGHVTVVPNGVDCRTFRPEPMVRARRRLGLPETARILLSVGDRVERKGFHLLVDALPHVLKEHGDVHLVIVGGPGRHGRDDTARIEQRIADNGVGSRVHLVGARPHRELARWYSAGDVFALLSSREGSPNVLLEALSCGVPSVATPVGGIPQELSDERLGLLLPERSAAAAAEGLCRALSRDWDRDAIRGAMLNRSWQSVAEQLDGVFKRALRINVG